jgi:hypothetical protein
MARRRSMRGSEVEVSLREEAIMRGVQPAPSCVMLVLLSLGFPSQDVGWRMMAYLDVWIKVFAIGEDFD